MGRLYGAVSDLGVEVEGYSLRLNRKEVSKGFERVTTEITVHGDSEKGRGEDVTYDAESHRNWVDLESKTNLTGSFSLDGFSNRLDGIDLFPGDPPRPYYRNYRRWGLESAVLDLALKQAETNLGGILGRDYSDVRFVVSRDLGDPPSVEKLHDVVDIYPEAEFKLDATTEWDSELVSEIPEEKVMILDMKGMYDEDLDVSQPPDPSLYSLVSDSFPDAIIEDPKLTDETRGILSDYGGRISWDKPVESLADVKSVESETGETCINIKPSRFGTVESLFDSIDYCENNGIMMYGGGQFELGVGREQIQCLASLFYPDSPNDVAPRSYNSPPFEGAPRSPLETPPNTNRDGFGL
ncbi:hypothetical protein ACEU6E_04125 [Halorutilales archaeon Cl-col2-1]